MDVGMDEEGEHGGGGVDLGAKGAADAAGLSLGSAGDFAVEVASVRSSALQSLGPGWVAPGSFVTVLVEGVPRSALQNRPPHRVMILSSLLK